MLNKDNKQIDDKGAKELSLRIKELKNLEILNLSMFNKLY